MKYTALFATTAMTGLLLVSSAHAFDDSNWTWNKNVDETVTVGVDVDSQISPEGHVEIQDAQTLNGDVSARTFIGGDYLSNDSQDPTVPGGPLSGNGIPLNGTFTITGDYDANSGDSNITSADIETEGFEFFNGTFTVEEDDSEVSVQPSNFSFLVNMDGSMNGDALDPFINPDQFDVTTLDATTGLPHVSGSATALGNYKSIETETATFLDETQIHNALNELGAGYGVEAIAQAGTPDNPVEAAVNLDATSISNYLSVTNMAPETDNVLVADINQSTNANIYAEATSWQNLSGYNNLGNYTGLGENALPGQVADLTATAIGNYATVKVGINEDL